MVKLINLKSIASIPKKHPDYHAMKKAVQFYTASGSAHLNASLLKRNGVKVIGADLAAITNKKKTGSGLEKETKEKLKNTDKHLSKLIKQNKTTKDMHVYSGMSFTPEYNKKKDFHLPAYTSTSLSRYTGRGFSHSVNHSQHVYNPKTEEKVDWAEHKRYDTAKTNITKKINHHYGKIMSLQRLEHPMTNPKPTSDEIKQNKELMAHHQAKQKHYENKITELNKKTPDTIKKSYAYQHTMKIHVPSGSHAFYAEGQTENQGEHEVILHKGSKLHIHKTPTLDHLTKSVTWHAKLVHDGVRPTRHMNEKD